MKNPWGKKNPLLSMWLSGANAIAGAARGRAAAEAKRQTSATITRGAKQMSDALAGKAPAKKRRKR